MLAYLEAFSRTINSPSNEQSQNYNTVIHRRWTCYKSHPLISRDDLSRKRASENKKEKKKGKKKEGGGGRRKRLVTHIYPKRC